MALTTARPGPIKPATRRLSHMGMRRPGTQIQKRPVCRRACQSARMLLQNAPDRRLRVGRIRRRISGYLPRVPGGLPTIRRHPFSDRIVRLVHAIVRAAVGSDCGLAPWGFGRVHFARSFKFARDLDTKVAQYRRALCRVLVEKNVVAIGPQAWLAANE